MNKIWAIVPAAGVGARMSANVPKQYIEVAGKTVFEHTLQALLTFDAIEAVQVCLSAQDKYWQSLDIQYSHLLPPVEGGETRADSVLSGLNNLAHIAKDDDWVMVHDAARPCIDSNLLQRLVDTLVGSDIGGVLAVPIADTLKKVRAEPPLNIVESTVDRSKLWAAQTPQMFRYGLLKECLQSAITAAADITDEASAVELAGYQPLIVPSIRSNIKVTYPEDISLVGHYLKSS